NSGNVGIGTTITNSGAALSVMNGNVGIGTWVPMSVFQVNGTSENIYINSSGNVGIGTLVASVPLVVGTNAFTVGSNGAVTTTAGITTAGAYTQSGNGINAFSGNV